jgi:hypothetical protein
MGIHRDLGLFVSNINIMGLKTHASNWLERMGLCWLCPFFSRTVKTNLLFPQETNKETILDMETGALLF